MKKSLFILTVFMAIAVSINLTNQYILFPLALVGVAILNRSVFRILLRWKLWFFLAVLILAVPLFAGDKDASLLGVSYSSELFRTGIVMVQRSIVILLGLKLFTSRISLDRLAAAMRQTRFKKFSQVFSLSMRALPGIRSITVSTFHEHRKTRGERNFFLHTFDYAVKVAVRVLQYAENFSEEHSERELSND